MRISGSLFLLGLGAILIVSGFGYDLSLAGLPYPDPTTEMQERWLFHKRVSDRIIFSGLVFFGVGCVWKAAETAVIVV